MTERTPVDPFEQRLADLARAYTRPAAQPIDPLAMARAAMSAPVGRWAAFGRAWWPAIDGRLLRLLVAAGLVVVLGTLALAAGSMLRPHDPGRLVFVRDGDLFVSAIDGTGAVRIRGGGADGTGLGYLAVLWSPDARHIAAVRDLGGTVLTPAIDILEADGTLTRTIEPGPGGTPSLSWSPDSRRLAIATYAAQLRRDAADPTGDAADPTEGAIRLAIVGLDGSSQEIALPPASTWFASAQPEVWTVPDLSVQWSPDVRWLAVAWTDPHSVSRWHLVPTDGSAIQPLSALVEGRCRVPANLIDWFPDGRRLATVGDLAGINELCVEAVGSGDAQAGATPEPGTVAAIPDDPSSNLHGKLVLPFVSPDGSRIAISGFMDDFDAGRHVTTLRVYDLATGRATDLDSGTEKLVLAGTGAAHVTDTLEGEPIWMGGIAWTPDGRQLLYLSPEPGDGPKQWTIRAVDAAGGRASSPIVEGVRSFDLGYAH